MDISNYFDNISSKSWKKHRLIVVGCDPACTTWKKQFPGGYYWLTDLYDKSPAYN